MSGFRYDVFLSYSSADRAAVEELARRLKAEGLVPFFDDWEIIPGRTFQTALAEGLRDSKTCAVCLGPGAPRPWQEEVQVARDRRAQDPEFHVLPVLLPGAERPRRGDVAHLEFLINASWVEFLRTLDDERAFRKLVCGIRGEAPGPAPGAAAFEGQCPYRGLEAFGPDDAPFFFGRENLTGWLVSDLGREVRAAQGVRFLAVLGPSGSGKSSVVLAGLIPRLRHGAIEGSERWPVAIVRPGDDTLQGLARAIVVALDPAGGPPDIQRTLRWDDAAQQLARRLGEEDARLDGLIRTALHPSPPETRLVVAVDQFEEVFTYRPGDDQARWRFEHARERFLSNLLQAAAAPGGRLVVVLTMRSDFLGACSSIPRLNDMLNAHLEQVGPMREEELRAAIERPAYLAGCELEKGLTESLLGDVKGQPGALRSCSSP